MVCVKVDKSKKELLKFISPDIMVLLNWCDKFRKGVMVNSYKGVLANNMFSPLIEPCVGKPSFFRSL